LSSVISLRLNFMELLKLDNYRLLASDELFYNLWISCYSNSQIYS
jgi:hypothetical protein